MKKYLVVLAGLLAGSISTYAQSDEQQLIVDKTTQLVQSMEGADFNEVAQDSLNSLVRAGVQALFDGGFEDEAQKSSDEWETKFSTALTSQFQVLDLGDHAPLNQWLADFYNTLQSSLGAATLQKYNLDDIRTFNFAIPVVFHPSGVEDDKWDMVEYRKHFVPFAAATVYWSGRLICKIEEDKIDPETCVKYVGMARSATQNYIGAPLSDYVYRKVTEAPGENELPQFDIKRLISESR